MSTTLATNALVEGQGGRVALVMIGFTEADLARDGLKTALGTDPVVFCPGGHDVHGRAQELDLATLEAMLPELGRFGVGLRRLRLFRHPQSGARDRRARPDPLGDRRCPSPPATSCRPSSAARAGAHHAAQRAADLDDRPAGRRHRRLPRGAQDRRPADGGARRRRAGLGRLRPRTADRDDPVRPRRQPRRRRAT